MLTENARLSKVSATPGKTLLVNHFIINEKWYLVDLPGYGYAKTGRTMRNTIAHLINAYLRQRTALVLLFLLIDSRIAPQKIDMEFIDFLGNEGIPFNIIFTKTDKISQSSVKKTILQWKHILRSTWEELPTMLLSSSTKGTGRTEILAAIENSMLIINKLDNEQN
jgi:GTP-binding protein